MRDSEDRDEEERPSTDGDAGWNIREGTSRAGGRETVEVTSSGARRHRPATGRRRAPAANRAGREQATDPVKERFTGEYDLYDIATWEVRSRVDAFAVSLTGFLQRARSRLLISTALVLFLAQLGVAGSLVIEQPVFGVLAVLSVVPALFVAVTLWYRDPTTREPFEMIAVTFLLSMLFASFAAVVNTVLSPGFRALGAPGLILYFFVVVGPIEETVKWLAIRVRAYHSEVFRTVVDGAVYGAVAGLGFAAIENFVYIAGAGFDAAPQGQLAQVEYATMTAATRAFVGPGHVIFSAWAGFYLGLAKFNPDNWLPIVIKGLLIAAFIHATYNTMVGFVPFGSFAAVGIPPGLAFIGIALGFHIFWFRLLNGKIRRYRELYDEINSAG